MTASTSYAQPPRLRANVDQLDSQWVFFAAVQRLGSGLIKDLGRLQLVQDLQRTCARIPELKRAVLMTRYDYFRVATGHRRPLTAAQRPLPVGEVGAFTAGRSTHLWRGRRKQIGKGFGKWADQNLWLNCSMWSLIVRCGFCGMVGQTVWGWTCVNNKTAID